MPVTFGRIAHFFLMKVDSDPLLSSLDDGRILVFAAFRGIFRTSSG